MALTPEQIEQQILDLGKEMETDLGAAILDAAQEVIDSVIKPRMNFKENSANGVRATIAAFWDASSYSLGIKMPAHGYFQNFGVTGLDNKTYQMGLDANTARAFGVAPDYQFSFGEGGQPKPDKHYWGIHYPGIGAKNFLQLEDFTQRVTDLVNENLEL